MSKAAAAAAIFEKQVGQSQGTGEWLLIDQERINVFAEVTEDRQFIHVDPEAAANGPFGVPIAHGFLTLSLLTVLTSTIPADFSTLDGIMAGVNYGFDKVRFVAPVKVNSKIRASSVVAAVVLKGNSIDITKTITVEIEGSEKPALVADWITRAVYVD